VSLSKAGAARVLLGAKLSTGSAPTGDAVHRERPVMTFLLPADLQAPPDQACKYRNTFRHIVAQRLRGREGQAVHTAGNDLTRRLRSVHPPGIHDTARCAR
jgi:hypothetical protein